MAQISETAAARTWIEQFDQPDRAIARLLLDELIVVAPGNFSGSVRDAVMDIVNANKRAVALYPIWEVADDESIFSKGRVRVTKGRAKIVGPQRGISGSVGLSVQLIAEIARSDATHVIDRAELSTLRATKCNHAILIDDFIGSGDRLAKYLSAFYAHKTVKSWCSSGLLSITAVCYGATQSGIRRVLHACGGRGCPPRPRLRIVAVRPLVAGRAAWTKREYDAFADVCRKYARRTSRPRFALGYKDAFSMIVFPHGVPNTSPAILWANGSEWAALFPERNIPSQVLTADADDDSQEERLVDTLGRLREARLAKSEWRSSSPLAYQRLLIALALAARRKLAVAYLSELLEVGTAESERILNAARAAQLIGDDQRLTGFGKSELRAARRQVSRGTTPPSVNHEAMYFPRALRGSQ